MPFHYFFPVTGTALPPPQYCSVYLFQQNISSQAGGMAYPVESLSLSLSLHHDMKCFFYPWDFNIKMWRLSFLAEYLLSLLSKRGTRQSCRIASSPPNLNKSSAMNFRLCQIFFFIYLAQPPRLLARGLASATFTYHSYPRAASQLLRDDEQGWGFFVTF